MSKDKSINVCRNWEITKFGQKCRISIIRKLLKIKMFTPEAVEGFKERRQLRRAVKYMEIILHQIRENKYPFPLKFSTGSIELGSTLERKLANLLIPEVIESLKAKGRLRDALRYMRLLFPEPFRTPQVNDVITSTKYTLGIKIKNGNVNINNLEIIGGNIFMKKIFLMI